MTLHTYDWSVLTIYNSDEERTFTVMSDVNSVWNTISGIGTNLPAASDANFTLKPVV